MQEHPSPFTLTTLHPNRPTEGCMNFSRDKSSTSVHEKHALSLHEIVRTWGLAGWCSATESTRGFPVRVYLTNRMLFMH